MKTRTRKTTRVLCASAIAMMTLLSSAAPAFAGNSDAAKSVAPATPAFSFSKYLLLKNNANVPQASFTFTAKSNDDKAGTEVNGYTVFKGSDAGMPTIGNANFTSGQDTFNEKQGTDEVSLTSGYKYAKSTVNVTFENASFTRPGIYRYTIKENDVAASYFNSDTSPKYLDVYKYNDGTFTYIMHSTNTLFTTAEEANKDTKITSISNTYKTQDLKVKKDVRGNQAVNDDFFKFTVNISGLVPGVTVNATGLSKTKNETQSWIADDEGKVIAKVYLSADSGVATFNGLTEGATYTVTEEAGNYTQESATVDGETPNTTLDNARAITDDDDTVVFTNKKEGTIPTGIYLNHKLPFNIAGIAILGGAISLVAKKRHDALEEDDDE